MPLFSDTVALRAFAAIERLDLIRQYDPELVIAPAVLVELSRYRPAMETEIGNGWVDVRAPSKTEVAHLRAAEPELHQGEAETLALFVRDGDRNSRLLIDEGNAYRIIRSALPVRRTRMRCLAQVLHELEEIGSITSAATLFQEILDVGEYRWSHVVRRDYEAWCDDTGRIPLA